MATLKQKHDEFIARLKAQGTKILEFKCPACGKKIETQAAPKGDTWDSLSNCPHCEALYMKIVTNKKAVGQIPQRPAASSN